MGFLYGSVPDGHQGCRSVFRMRAGQTMWVSRLSTAAAGVVCFLCRFGAVAYGLELPVVELACGRRLGFTLVFLAGKGECPNLEVGALCLCCRRRNRCLLLEHLYTTWTIPGIGYWMHAGLRIAHLGVILCHESILWDRCLLIGVFVTRLHRTWLPKGSIGMVRLWVSSGYTFAWSVRGCEDVMPRVD